MARCARACALVCAALAYAMARCVRVWCCLVLGRCAGRQYGLCAWRSAAQRCLCAVPVLPGSVAAVLEQYCPVLACLVLPVLPGAV